MSSYIADISSLYSTTGTTMTTSTSSSSSLDMTDFLQLMVAQLENQTIDDTADTSDMLNQLVQMQVVQSINQITEVSQTMYAGSLVGKEVTVGQYDSSGALQKTVGTVTGTGYVDGSMVVFVDGATEPYALSSVLAVGRLPETVSTEG
jgi:flagellar basal-body rod modification protein FlgD